jgi:protein Tex
MTNTYISLIAKALNIPKHSVQNTIELLNEGATVPFISRYRKEMTGSLDEVQIGDIKTQLAKLQEVDKRRESILKSIEEQGKLTAELQQQITETYDMTVLEDLYLPYKRKRKTRASIAKEKGLEPLAVFLLEQKDSSISREAQKFINEEVENIEEALQGARDIIAEQVNEDMDVRNKVRFQFSRQAIIRSKVARGKEDEAEKYKDYFKYEEALKNIPSHRLLAIRRGEEEGFLRVTISPENEEEVIHNIEKLYVKTHNEAAKQVKLAIEDAYTRLLSASIETEFRNLAKDIADEEAIKVFVDNLRQLLLTSPLGEKRVLAIDPGFRTGCKVVCLNENGTLLYNTAIYPHQPQMQIKETSAKLQELVKTYQIEAFAIGNGTAGRETETLVRGINFDKNIDVFMVNEAGASIYSASDVAREEFPDYDVTVRGAVSIGRRLMDPLAELVKIDPKSIGVGQYQHDVNQSALKSNLDATVESCVNSVGVNLNTASKHLLTYVSGLGDKLAENIVAYRAANGAFKTRIALKKVPRLGDKAFEQAAGFLRIRDADNPLDNTAVHPESYHIVEQMAKDLHCTVQDLIINPFVRKHIDLQKYVTKTIGMPTLKDIIKELDKPGLDPRGKAKAFAFTPGINSISDLHEGMIVNGIITNITNFGAFTDIGIKENGLIHLSQMANRFIKNPNEVLKLNQTVEARVISIDLQRKRIQLSLK